MQTDSVDILQVSFLIWTGQTKGPRHALQRQVKSESQILPKELQRFHRGRHLVNSKAREPIEFRLGIRRGTHEKNKLDLKLDDGVASLTVSKMGKYQNRLARDIVGYLAGKRSAPDMNDYSLPWYFWVTSALPLGVLIVAGGGAVPGMIGFGFASGCYAIAQVEEWPEWVRLLLSLALGGFAYAVFIIAAIIFVVMKNG
jgi:hypothetical protein